MHNVTCNMDQSEKPDLLLSGLRLGLSHPCNPHNSDGLGTAYLNPFKKFGGLNNLLYIEGANLSRLFFFFFGTQI